MVTAICGGGPVGGPGGDGDLEVTAILDASDICEGLARGYGGGACDGFEGEATWGATAGAGN